MRAQLVPELGARPAKTAFRLVLTRRARLRATFGQNISGYARSARLRTGHHTAARATDTGRRPGTAARTASPGARLPRSGATRGADTRRADACLAHRAGTGRPGLAAHRRPSGRAHRGGTHGRSTHRRGTHGRGTDRRGTHGTGRRAAIGTGAATARHRRAATCSALTTGTHVLPAGTHTGATGHAVIRPTAATTIRPTTGATHRPRRTVGTVRSTTGNARAAQRPRRTVSTSRTTTGNGSTTGRPRRTVSAHRTTTGNACAAQRPRRTVSTSRTTTGDDSATGGSRRTVSAHRTTTRNGSTTGRPRRTVSTSRTTTGDDSATHGARRAVRAAAGQARRLPVRTGVRGAHGHGLVAVRAATTGGSDRS
ncbi:hypothetical protein [Actinoplanes sp. CA-252034]|uniref:hypothetical protein n=1 Tax=Actinoplanes sp. CA-252034 TaxID=3239906 RepID=UPI003D97B2F1